MKINGGNIEKMLFRQLSSFWRIDEYSEDKMENNAIWGGGGNTACS